MAAAVRTLALLAHDRVVRERAGDLQRQVLLDGDVVVGDDGAVGLAGELGTVEMLQRHASPANREVGGEALAEGGPDTLVGAHAPRSTSSTVGRR